MAVYAMHAPENIVLLKTIGPHMYKEASSVQASGAGNLRGDTVYIIRACKADTSMGGLPSHGVAPDLIGCWRIVIITFLHGTSIVGCLHLQQPANQYAHL